MKFIHRNAYTTRFGNDINQVQSQSNDLKVIQIKMLCEQGNHRAQTGKAKSAKVIYVPRMLTLILVNYIILINVIPETRRDIHVFATSYHWVDTFARVPSSAIDGIICPEVCDSKLTWFIKYIYA
jgi:hypothetical protein